MIHYVADQHGEPIQTSTPWGYMLVFSFVRGDGDGIWASQRHTTVSDEKLWGGWTWIIRRYSCSKCTCKRDGLTQLSNSYTSIFQNIANCFFYTYVAICSYLQLLDRHVLGLWHQKRIEICACLCMRKSMSAGIRQIKILPNFVFFDF